MYLNNSNLNDKQDSLKKINMLLGFQTKNNDVSLYYYGKLLYKSNFYVYLYPRIVTNRDKFPRYTGKERKISRLGYSSGETDLSGMGYQNNWLLLQLGRGRQEWSAGKGISLAISDDSPSYDYGLLGLDFGQIRYKYFHGFLETDSIFTNRFITAKGIEITNNSNLIFSFSEIVIYSGIHRGLAIPYLNPVSSHLEIELNDRSNNMGIGSGNAVWQLAFDSKIKKNMRLSLNLVIDEFILDSEEKNEGKTNGVAMSSKLVWIKSKPKNLMSIYISYIHVGTHTFRHENGANNFVHRGLPLGTDLGSDMEKFSFGLNYYNKKNIIFEIETGVKNIGENTIINNPYDPYENYNVGPFPSGNVDVNQFFKIVFEYWYRKNISFSTHLDYLHSTFNNTELLFDFSLNVFFDDLIKKF
tara:strand:- start:1013 stop:2251 length:1239 start_codon:yes stop_codon:yes gene_type:complete